MDGQRTALSGLIGDMLINNTLTPGGAIQFEKGSTSTINLKATAGGPYTPAQALTFLGTGAASSPANVTFVAPAVGNAWTFTNVKAMTGANFAVNGTNFNTDDLKLDVTLDPPGDTTTSSTMTAQAPRRRPAQRPTRSGDPHPDERPAPHCRLAAG